MRYLGMDLGTKSLGLALSDKTGLIASFYKNINYEDEDKLIDEIESIIEKEHIEKLVLGLPKHMDNSLGFAAERSLKFKELLESKCDLKVNLIDERLSTVEAENILIKRDYSRKKRKNNIDELSACIILDTYLRKVG